MIKLGQIPTPSRYVEALLDSAKYEFDVIGKSVLENSCGDGSVLVEIVKRYILDGRRKKLPDEDIGLGLSNDIVAYDVDNEAINNAVNRLNKLCNGLDFPSETVSWNINCEDYLKQGVGKYDYVIGNPPYITYTDLPESERIYLRKTFKSCCSNRFDYSYAFIEKSIMELSNEGTLSYLVPFSIFRNKYADGLRDIMQPMINRIIDYSGLKVFPGRTIGVAIIVCKSKSCEKFLYEKIHDKIRKTITKENLTDKWIFESLSKSQSNRKFGDYFNVSNSVATLKNDVFILDDYSMHLEFERELILGAVSSKSFKLKQKLKIIFPYDVNDDEVKNIPEDIFRHKFPNVYNYLLSKKGELLERSLPSCAKWYEYGRAQSLTSVLQEKLVIPMIITGRVIAYYAKRNEVPFAGYYIVAKNNEFPLSYAAQIIESKNFYEYAKVVGTPTTRNSYRLSVRDIMEYTIDDDMAHYFEKIKNV